MRPMQRAGGGRRARRAGPAQIALACALPAIAWAATAAPPLAGAAAAAPTGLPACPPAGAHVVAEGRRLRVYSTGAGTSLDRTRVSACVRGGGTPLTLIAPRTRGIGGVSLGAVAIAGSVVAYVERQHGIDTGSSRLVVADVAARRLLRSAPAGRFVDAGIIVSERLRDLAIAPDGAVGWTVERGGRQLAATVRVYGAGRTGPVRLLDEGADIGAESLSLSGHRLSWWHAGAPRRAELAH